MENYLRWLGFVEAASMLVLLLIAMPLKYAAGRPEYVHWVGTAHGALFVAYCLFGTVVAQEKSWPKSRMLFAFLASVLPLGPFVLDQKVFPTVLAPVRDKTE